VNKDVSQTDKLSAPRTVRMFNYTTLQVSLESKTRTLKVLLNRPEHENQINTEMLFELESIFAWAASRIEINSILLSSTSDVFCTGFDKKELARFDSQKLTKQINKLRKIIKAFFYMPQTIIVDLKNAASGAGLELAIGADIRVCNKNGKFSFNHLNEGLTPTCGGISLLSKIVAPSFARTWILSSQNISYDSLIASGFTQENNVDDILIAINNQAPIERIQTKNAFNLSIMNEIESLMTIEENTSLTTTMTEDWKQSEFLSARTFSAVAKQAASTTCHNLRPA